MSGKKTAKSHQQPLGEILIQAAVIGQPERNRALAISRNTKTRIGEVLISEGIIGYPLLYQALAAQRNLQYVDLIEFPPDYKLLDEQLANEYLAYLAIPYQRRGKLFTIVTSEYNEKTISWAKSRYGNEIIFAITSPRDIHKTIQNYFSKTLLHQSSYALYEKSPELSAHRKRTANKIFPHKIFSQISTIIFSAIFTILCYLCLSFPASAITIILTICHLLYIVTMLFKLVIYATGVIKPSRETLPEYNNYLAENKLSANELPIYTILIPMYNEKESLPKMLNAMSKMDYPASKLDIKLVFEEDDQETIQAAYNLKPRYNFEIIRVPASEPRTKPKACNFALNFARGEYVTVYDADDIPEPQQLKKAVQIFRSQPEKIACLQARLNYYNLHDNLLTRLFSLEYSMLFDVMLPGMSRLDMPVMLGGTSNHFAISRLRELGNWDPFNVTEDADLGTRLAVKGFEARMFDSITIEEAPNTILAWLYQRARWIKGYMQTWLVHMRRPYHLYKALGWHGFSGFQCFVALSSFSYLTAPIAWTLSISLLITPINILPNWLCQLAAINLFLHLILHNATALHVACLHKKYRKEMIISALFYPFYLILHSIASYVALWQLWLKPYIWNKTSHGKARSFNDFN